MLNSAIAVCRPAAGLVNNWKAKPIPGTGGILIFNCRLPSDLQTCQNTIYFNQMSFYRFNILIWLSFLALHISIIQRSHSQIYEQSQRCCIRSYFSPIFMKLFKISQVINCLNFALDISEHENGYKYVACKKPGSQ
jgi:hypothetical protein